jgi:cytochrome c biogenesis protein ResB
MIETGWMGLKFRLLRYLPTAREVVTYFPAKSNSPLAQPAIRLKFDGEYYWLGSNSLIRLYKGQEMYLISYGQRQIELPFNLVLSAFRMEKYEGTERASGYASDVDVPGKGKVTISMNDPLQHGGFTFYQSSFEQDGMGKPVASILSVNYDPGRWIKYLGSVFIVLGTIMLFYFRRLYFV